MSILYWLKFFPFAKAQYERPIIKEISGPYFSKLWANNWRFVDSIFLFNAPWANPVMGFDGCGRTVGGKQPRPINILAGDLERVFGGASDSWDLDFFYENTWYFVGPWFTGPQASLRASSLLVSASRDSEFIESNIFHPRVFEEAIANYLDKTYGYDRSGKKPHYRGPLNWRVLPISSSLQAVVCDIHQIHNGSKENPSVSRLVFFPVSKHQFVRVLFDFGGISIHDEIRAKPLFALCDSIIDSMRLNVGKSTQAQWDQVKATCPDMSLTENFGELPWPLIKEKPSKKPKERDITPGDEAKRMPFKP
ncbi:hypothetical protein [Thalassolituus sp.]|uniref:hypothetical protein n=1 Tax=Thalassolituus sp. TaxID=2030822 RepID=UPI002A811231|nr:hypothetical protein [Thalassolituus sp.]